MSNISVSWYRLSWLHTINSSQKGWNSANPPLMLGGGGGVGDRITRNRPTRRPIWHYTRLFTTNSGIIKGPWSGRFTRKGGQLTFGLAEGAVPPIHCLVSVWRHHPIIQSRVCCRRVWIRNEKARVGDTASPLQWHRRDMPHYVRTYKERSPHLDDDTHIHVSRGYAV